MYLVSKISEKKPLLFNTLISLFPVFFVAGNMLINIGTVLLIISTLICFGKKLFKIKFYLLDKFLVGFFVLILITGLINDYYFFADITGWESNFASFKKSVFFLKYLFIYFILRFLIENKIINLKYFFITSTLICFFVSFDIILQFLTGKDIFGFEGVKNNLAGPFGDELIAGGYIQRFSIFSFFLIPLFYKQSFKNYLKYLIPISFIVFFITIILSGNRMPLLLFLFAISLIIIFNKQTRKFFLPTLVIATIIFYLFINFNSKVNENFRAFYDQISKMTVIVIEKDLKNNYVPPYLREFLTFYETWKMHKYIGGGIKNFRYYCHHRQHIDKNSKSVCNMHPHNYYLEILTETGILGFLLISIFFLSVLHLTFVKKYFTNSVLKNNNIIIPFIFLFISEIFPIKSTGSFFTTGNTTYLFLIIGILVGLARKDISIEKKF
tara:strand:- start:1149 stop:2465 length:1317 start_codon:yes stop_codon:yes gene_type:complete